LLVELPKAGPLVEAKLLSLPVLPAPKPPPKPLPRPEPRLANPEAAVLANGDAPAAAANPLAAGFSDGVESAALKMEGVLLPNVPKGDCSDLANDASPDAANEDEDVTFFVASSPSVDWAPSEAKGETADVLRNDLGRDD
jgi:hypothetical protein